MSNITQFLIRHSLICGFILMFLFTWPIGFANAGVLPIKVPYVVSMTYGWGISLASLFMTGLTLGRDGVITLLKRFLIWRVNWKWYLIAFLLYPAVFATAVLVKANWTQISPDFSSVMAHDMFGAPANLSVFIIPFFIVDLLTNGEEMGWRGYVLPRLQARHSALVSSLIVGAIWGFWHLPRYRSHHHRQFETGKAPACRIDANAKLSAVTDDTFRDQNDFEEPEDHMKKLTTKEEVPDLLAAATYSAVLSAAIETGLLWALAGSQ